MGVCFTHDCEAPDEAKKEYVEEEEDTQPNVHVCNTKELKEILTGFLDFPIDILQLIAEFGQQPYFWKGNVKALLCGTRKSGKSTIAGQLAYIMNGRDTYALNRRRVNDNVLVFHDLQRSIEDLTTGMDADWLCMTNSETRGEWIEGPGIVVGENGQRLKDLWGKREVRERFESRAALKLFHINSNLPYFMEHIDRILDPNYEPTTDDLLRCYVRNTGIVEINLTFESGASLIAYDVGGCRPERKKWIHCFEHLNAIIYVTDLSAYDEVLFEDVVTRCLEEDETLLREILSKGFQSVMVCINKMDLFAKKIKNIPFTVMYPDFPGDPHDVEECKEYYKERLNMLRTEAQENLEFYFSNGIDASDIRYNFMPDLEKLCHRAKRTGEFLWHR